MPLILMIRLNRTHDEDFCIVEQFLKMPSLLNLVWDFISLSMFQGENDCFHENTHDHLIQRCFLAESEGM
jgi:hypothetical protein